MEIEKVINHQFKDNSQKLIAELLYSANWMENLIAKTLKPLDISFQQLNVLRIIHGQEEGRASVQLIKERMIDDSSNVSRLLNKLCEKGLTSKDRCVVDQRVVYIELSSQGKEVMQKGKNLIEEITFSMADQKLQQLNQLLDELRH